MTMPHTPAPWSLGSNGATTKVVDADGKAICMVTYRKDHWNGDLLAAAPELLACLLDVLDADGDLDAMDFNRYRAAITKARGNNE
jgi:hypothetical protein